MRKIIYTLFLTFFATFSLPVPVSAHSFGTFTASNYSYDVTTHHLKFDASNFSATETGWYPEFGISSPTWSPTYAYHDALVLPPSTTHFEDDLIQFPNPVPTDSTNVSLYVYGATSDIVFLSQPIPAVDLIAVTPPSTPTNKDDCKKDGWMGFVGFKNQGSCISFVEKVKNLLHL